MQISRKEVSVVLTSIALLVVSVALIAMSIALAIASHNLYLERRKNSELSEELRRPPRVEVMKLAEPGPGYMAEYDIRIDGNVTQTIRIPKECPENDRLSL